MSDLHHFTQIDFRRFKAFESFTLHLRPFNILVGPNNAGKSTILAAFRVLAAALRKASVRAPEPFRGPQGRTFGYSINLTGVSVAEENLFFNYDDSIPATVRFHLSNGARLLLYFPEQGACYLTAECDGPIPKSPSAFRKHFNCPIGFVPILGPVEHNEPLYQEEAARLALFNYTASRNFRNIWHHYPAKFDEFRRILQETWPGMDIERPRIDFSHGQPRLHMFCPEERVPREIFWAGFGFQVWCQMLTHLVQSNDKALFLIDEPDIYLHAELQRQLLALLRNLGPDILIATHSTEIITEAEADDIVLVSKKRRSARRIKRPSELSEVFGILGSTLNPVLTQLAKTRRAVFVEGKDFQIIGKFARKLKAIPVANRTEFAVIPVEGFSPERIRNLKKGMETTLGGLIAAAAILDRDYRSQAECDAIARECSTFCDVVTIHACKEIENFLLCAAAIDRAAAKRVADNAKRSGKNKSFAPCAGDVLDTFSVAKKTYVLSQCLAAYRKFQRATSPSTDEATVNETRLLEFEKRWSDQVDRLAMIPGKDAVSQINQHLQERFGVSVTPTAVIDNMTENEIPDGMKVLVKKLSDFAIIKPGANRANSGVEATPGSAPGEILASGTGAPQKV